MRVKRRRIASVDAVPVRIAVAYLIIWSYCWAIRSHRIGRVKAGPSSGYLSRAVTTDSPPSARGGCPRPMRTVASHGPRAG